MTNSETVSLRVDKWLWCARFFKTRSLATKVVSGGHLRVNGTRVAKPGQKVSAGDVLTFPQAREVRVVRVAGIAERRGPASEARNLYEDLTPPTEKDLGAPRPVKDQVGRKSRRISRGFKRSTLE